MTAAAYSVSPPDAHPGDVDRLVELVSVVEATQRAEDVDGFLALFHPDAVWVTGGGRRLVGRDVIAAFTRSVLPGAMRGASVRYAVSGIRFLSDGVAVTWVDQEYLDAAGRSLSPRSLGMPTYTWARSDGNWLIVAGQNTGVPAEDVLAEDAPAEPEALAALQAVVQRVEDGFNRNDARLMTADVAAEAVLVDASGRVLRGRPGIVAAAEAGLASPYLRDTTAHYRLLDVASPAPDVRVATKEAWSSEADADAGRPPEMRALYVFVRRDGAWLIERRANVLVREAV
ncbi:SgcJ/EcaC family oxidoreductase [Modestobacter altitudinis]|uniref:SgcJ/EcaC family oxidoreductase n=1 Tax=Modestobacter altitudinis TaxID=2213158 RepID=UPI00110D2301|nr:SgcJ/EcaC family oxidoreductase [Modestobacter altitudinis]